MPCPISDFATIKEIFPSGATCIYASNGLGGAFFLALSDSCACSNVLGKRTPSRRPAPPVADRTMNFRRLIVMAMLLRPRRDEWHAGFAHTFHNGTDCRSWPSRSAH